LYRQSEIYAREGVDLERSTLAGWVGATSELLNPLHEALRRYVMSAGKLHADDTPVPVLAPGQGRTKQGRLWTYVRDDRPAGDRAARQSGLLIRLTAEASIRIAISPISRARCRPMPMPASTGCTTQVASRRRPAGHMSAASSLTCTRHTLLPSPRKFWNASALYMGLKARSGAVRRMKGNENGKLDRDHY
jgi:Transposase IS66 family